MDKVIVSLFGAENFAWPRCTENDVILTISDDDLHPLWVSGDRDSFVKYALKNKKTQRGNKPNASTASRWYGLHSNIAETHGDYWLHRSGDDLWWTISKSDPHVIRPAGVVGANGVPQSFIEKPCEPWSNKNKKGIPLRWNALHPKARMLLSTQSTQISLSDENKEYVLALLDGEDLSPWHRRSEWQALSDRRGTAGTVFDAKARMIWRIVAGVKNTVAHANGQMVERFQKNKELRLSEERLRKLIEELFEDQDGLCAISEIPLQLDGEETDKRLLCSLDRKDSDGHYEEGNLQLVCAFINKWKSSESDDEIKRLLKIVRTSSRGS